MSKFKPIKLFFKRKEVDVPESNIPLDFNAETSNLKERPLKSQRVEAEEHPYESLSVETQEILFKSSTLNVNEFDAFFNRTGSRITSSMWDYLVNRRDEIRMAYLKACSYQFLHSNYPLLDQKIIVVAFKFLGSHNFHLGLSILLLRMLHIVCHVIFL
jgi:hypothetical protein